ncbi:MAG TPA: hypothetical protein VJR50_10855 [Mycobacterium sp.]|nr:hypothetical protein [Mycobacterium sp.]
MDPAQPMIEWWFSNDYPVWSVTRFGTATLRSGRDAVRQHITDRTGL